jgi:hypothetical protein
MALALNFSRLGAPGGSPKEPGMIPCERFAFFTLARDASFVTLAGVTMMIGFSFAPPLAFKIGASVALLFAILLLMRSYMLTDERFRRCEAWRALRPEERPAGEHGREFAQRQFDRLLLRFAKTSSAISSVLYGFSLILSLNAPDDAIDTFVTAGMMNLR